MGAAGDAVHLTPRSTFEVGDETAAGGLSGQFEAFARKMAPLHRALIVDNLDPSSLTASDLMLDLGHEFLQLEVMSEWMRASSCTFREVISVPCALSATACAVLRDAVDADHGETPDTVDMCPEHQLTLSEPREQLAELVGLDAARRLLQLPSRYLRKRAATQQEALPASSCQGARPNATESAGPLDGFEPFMPHLRRRFDPEAGAAGAETDGTLDADAIVTLEEAFVRRYSNSTRPFHPLHQDRFRLTVNVALSSDADHGGGRLLGVCNQQVLRFEREEGEAIIHSSELIHGVTKMTSGVRYSLILFFSTRPRPKPKTAPPN